MAYMATSEVPPDGTPPQIKVTVETVEELAAVLESTPALVEARIVDDEHPEYGEGVQTRRLRGQERDFSEKQLYLGGRPMNEDEKKSLDRHRSTVKATIEKYHLSVKGVA